MRKKLSIGLFAGLIAAVGVLLFAYPFGGIFELGPNDGTTDIWGVAGYPPDWADIFDSNGMPIDSDSNGIPDYEQVFGGIDAVFIQDDLAVGGLKDDTMFAGSNKNDDLVPTWQWDTGNVPPKDDLANIYAYAVMNGSNDLIIYIGLERLAPNGASHIDVGLHQAGIGLDKDPPCDNDGVLPGEEPVEDDGSPCEFTGMKVNNDILVVMDFEQGGALGLVEVRRWDAAASAYTDPLVIIGEGDEPGEGCDPLGLVCAWNNGNTIPAGPWPTFDRHGNLITSLETNAFTEIGINITQLLNDTPCITTIQAKTRSSPSFNSELKDFAMGTFEMCGVEVTKDGDTLSKIGDEVTYSYTISNTGVAPLWAETVTDDKVGDLTPEAVGCDPLDPGEDCTFDVDHTIPDDASDPYDNIVTATYNSKSDLSGLSFQASDDHSVNLFQPGVEVDLTVDPTLTKAGHDITFTYTVTNTSSEDTPTLILDSISDTFFEPPADGLDNLIDAAVLTDLADLEPGDEITFDITYTVDPSDTGPITNIFTVHYHPDNFENDITDDSDEVRVDLFDPSVTVDLVADCDQAEEGVQITFTATVENTSTSSGDIPDLIYDNFTTSDPFYGTPDPSSCSPLVAGSPCNFSWTYTIQQGDPDLSNILTIHYHPENFTNDIYDDGTANVDVVHPDFTITKTCTPSQGWIGHPISIEVTIENTGDVPITLESISDDHVDISGVPEVALCASLDVGESCTFWYGYTIQASDIPDPFPITPVYLTNTVTASYVSDAAFVECPGDPIEKFSQCSVLLRPPDQGCTPGFWKTHTHLWDGVGTDDVTSTIKTYLGFNATFGVTEAESGLPDSTTLLEALSVSGSGGKDGDLMALNRHAAAALCNADSGINYWFYDVASVIAFYQAAVFDGRPPVIREAKETLNFANERGCPLN